MSARRVVITGMGVVTALGDAVDEFWDRILRGESGVATIPGFDPTAYPVHFAGVCTGFKPEDYISDRREIKRMDRFAQMAIAAGKWVSRSNISASNGKTCPHKRSV